MSKFVYADHAATTRISDAALAAMTDSLASDWGNPFSLYRLGQAAKEALAKARADVAACLNAAPEEIFFTSGGTESDNWALRDTEIKESTSSPPPLSTTPSSTRRSTWKNRGMK